MKQRTEEEGCKEVLNERLALVLASTESAVFPEVSRLEFRTELDATIPSLVFVLS